MSFCNAYVDYIKAKDDLVQNKTMFIMFKMTMDTMQVFYLDDNGEKYE